MKKKLFPIGIAILTVISGVIVSYNLLIRYLIPIYLLHENFGYLNEAASIGIIGGADGPTSIYLTNKNSIVTSPVFLLLFIMGIMYFIVMRLRRNKKDKKD